MLQIGLDGARQACRIEVRPADPQHARGEAVQLAVGVHVAERFERQQVAPRGRAREAGARGGLGGRHARVLAVERLEDRQAFFEAGNPVASVEFGLFHRRKVASRCAVIAREWAIIARISPEAIADLKASIESTISILAVIERVTPIDLGCGVKGQETVYSPKIGPDHERVRLYMALGDTQSYRIGADARDLCGRHAAGLAAVPQHCRDDLAGEAALESPAQLDHNNENSRIRVGRARRGRAAACRGESLVRHAPPEAVRRRACVAAHDVAEIRLLRRNNLRLP
ncbi:hypothetical protein BC2230_11372 [Burkholderia cepacia]